MPEMSSAALISRSSQSRVGNKAQLEELTICCDHITKHFGPVIANDSVSCTIESGGIHAFLGENGAGKSTLMKILSGYYQPDAGSIHINGEPVSLKSPADARRLGIGMVHQQFTLVPSLTVLENILLGQADTPMILRPKKQAAAIAEKAAQYGINLDLHAPVSRLNMAEKQKVEILKLLWRNARILILDEPTSHLAPLESAEILSTMARLSMSGKIVILITHHIEELLKFAKMISVLRQGKLVANFSAESVQAEELARLMIGESFNAEIDGKIYSFETENNVANLELRGVNVKSSPTNKALKDLNIEIKSGEVHGIAGVMGSGQDELTAVLSGHLLPEKGEVFIKGQRSAWKDLSTPHKSVSHIPADAKRGSLPNLTLLENMLLRGIHKQELLFGPFIKQKEAERMTKERIETFDVRPKHTFALGGSLSGGNLQRLILAREFAKSAPLMVAVNPTASLDLAMSLRIRKDFRKYAADGKSVLLISPDLDELLKTCDRISVMFGGRVVGTEHVSNLNAESLGLLMGGNDRAAVQS